MEWFADFAHVHFGGIDAIFDVSSVFCEFTIGGNEFSIKWYGIIIAFGFILAALFGGRIAYTWKMDLSKMVDVLIYGTFGGIIGARAYYVAFEWDYYKQDPMQIFEIWNGGLAIYGGIIGGIIAAYITCKLEKLNFRNLLDLVGMSLLIGQGIGRWGNYANQEAFGTFTNGNYGMMSNKVSSYIIMNPEKYGLENVDDIGGYIEKNNLFVHPTFFYEFVWCMVGFLILYIILKRFRKFSGQLFLCYGIWYGLGRMIIEGLRTDSLYIGTTGIRVSQLLSAILVVVCLALLIFMLIKTKKHPVPIEGVDFFIERKKKPSKSEKGNAKKASEKAVEKKAAEVLADENADSAEPEVDSAEPEAETESKESEADSKGDSAGEEE